MSEATSRTRDYTGLLAACRSLTGDRAARMAGFVDLAWDALSGEDVSWLGFYLPDPENTEHMLLGPRRDKPACSPIGVHGACGQSFTQHVTLVVRDVAALGEGYVACDPKDLAELVIPLFDAHGECWGVLDLDSFSRGAFTTHDADALNECLAVAGLTSDTPPAAKVF
ncbi:MAG: GAF domain-containing protein [Phycisphaerales bacterium]|jgi:putative methionine-R-sulfoxide reductase with GAF domain